MANPRDNLGANALLNGEFYINDRTGRTHVRLPAGGTGGGITGYADQPATEEQHVAFLNSQAESKKAESEALHERHKEAHERLEKHQAKEREEEDAREKVEDKEAIDEPDVRNPITAETYGRPPMNPVGLDGAPQNRNPADERGVVDEQPRASPVKKEEVTNGAV
jgi:hypothetical protein